MNDRLLPGLLCGGLVLALCMSEPGGLDGSIGFCLGFVAYYAVLGGIHRAMRDENLKLSRTIARRGQG